MRMIRSWDVRKAFFNADLNEVIYVEPGDKLVQGWTLLVASEGTVWASHGTSDVG